MVGCNIALEHRRNRLGLLNRSLFLNIGLGPFCSSVAEEKNMRKFSVYVNEMC